MKKKLSVILITLGTASMLCGFDSAETAESILLKQQDAIENVSSTDTHMAINADIAIDFAGASLKATANGGIDVEVLMEEPAMKLEGSIDVLSPLLAQENTYDFKVYMKPKDSGTSDVYVYYANAVTGESNWDHDSDETIEISQLLNTSATADMNGLSKLGIEFTLAPEAADVDGTECYELSAMIDSTAFSASLDEISELTGEDPFEDENAAMAMEILEGLKINLTYYIDAETFLPIKMHLDLNDSDPSAIEELVTGYVTTAMESEEDLSITILLNDVSVDVETAYDTVTEIAVPDEALAAGSSVDVVPDDVEVEIGTAVETVTEASAQQ